MFRIPIHSIIDRITNSSTEIFTNYENSVQAGYDLIQEVLILLGVNEKAEDIVRINLVYENDGNEEDYPTGNFLEFIPLDKKYEQLILKAKSFINSPEQETLYC